MNIHGENIFYKVVEFIISHSFLDKNKQKC